MMKTTLSGRLSASLYEPDGGPNDTAEIKALMKQMVATLLIGAPMLLLWAFVYLYFGEMGAYIGFAAYAILHGAAGSHSMGA
jgi:ABC-type polysaccharide transport system permease subunit